MSNRIIKESILISKKMARLSAEAERHFYRLLLIVDDYGCFCADPEIIRGVCYPFMLDKITVDMIKDMNAELKKEKVLNFWKHEDKLYGVFLNFDEHNSKYCVTKDGKPTRHSRQTPEPPLATLCKSLLPLAGSNKDLSNHNHKPNHKHNLNPKPDLNLKQNLLYNNTKNSKSLLTQEEQEKAKEIQKFANSKRTV